MESGGGRSDPRPLAGEEEAIKRNTDCVYFLASPLTCKKGSECEYRHSEGARINPRDCKFWFSGTCLNPKCLFRHPPLDGLVGNAASTSGPVMAQVPASAHLPTPNASAYSLNRSSVPCYYFQTGTCLKGDKCLFMHFPQPAANPIARQIQIPIPKVSAPVSTQFEPHKKDAWKVKDCSSQQTLTGAPNQTVKVALSSAKVSSASESFDSLLVPKKILLPTPSRIELPISQSTGAVVGASSSFSQHREQHLADREAGEILEEIELDSPLKHQVRRAEEAFRESSPGFDVLVDDAADDADYPHERDGFRSGSGQGARGLIRLSDYDSAARFSRDRLHGVGDGDRRGISSISEGFLDKPALPVRRSAHRRRSPDGIDESDLRYRLMKHRKINGPLSDAISGHESEPYSRHGLKMQDRYSHNSYRDQRKLLPENNISRRLRGRIRLPKASSPEFQSDCGGWRKQRAKLQGRIGERLSQKPTEDSSGTARNSGSQQKDRHDADPLGFAGPRSLAELKGAKDSRNFRSISSPELNEMKFRKPEPEVSVSFDGPKPLNALMKRSAETAPENGPSIGVNDVREVAGEVEVGPFMPTLEVRSLYVLEARLEDDKAVGGEDEAYIPSEVEQITSAPQSADAATEARNDVEDDEIDYTDQREGDYDYERIAGRDYKVEDDEDMDAMNVDLDDDEEEEDEDDFAKKIGLIFS